ncbi:MAG: GTPase Era [Ignavibacteria bacterium]|nr:GTPase Era [Ignavibacteria bacterium]
MTENQTPYRSGYVAIVGEPNVGKSTLLNSLLQQKLSIVTTKPQTTRQRVRGILSESDAQIVFLDTPGLLEPKYLLQQSMVRSAEIALSDADVILLLIEVSTGTELRSIIAERVINRFPTKPILLIVNKIDTVPKLHILPIIDSMNRLDVFREIVPISASKGLNLDDLIRTIKSYLPVHPPLYPDDIVSDHPERFFAAELIREEIFQRFRDEVPYSTAVEIRDYTEREHGKIFISADIIVERSSQKAILIGRKGEALKKVGSAARLQIESFIGREVYLELFVKIAERWRKKREWLQRLGYGDT